MFAVIFYAEAGPDLSLAWLLYSELAFMILVIATGWLVSLNNRVKPRVKRETPARKVKKARGKRHTK